MKRKKIKILALDVDGTLTNGYIYISGQGEFFKAFNVQDGFGIVKLLPLAEIIPVIITGRKSKIVEKRCKELGIKFVFQGVNNKAEILESILDKFSLSAEESAFIGDDLSDYSAMQACGFKSCPADAVKEIQRISDYVSPIKAGHGAVRDIIEHLIRKQDGWNKVKVFFGI
jgi:3-deoxy-D-manno-octulosonate 8-phosphate phosphatase (KDO 8-P phosphatase)